VTTLKVADIVANSGVRLSHLDAQRVEMYRRSIDRLPPVVVFETEGGLLLADGHHRLAAAVAEGRETIEAEVRHGTRHDALAYAVTVGAAQKDMSPEEVRERIHRRYGEGTRDP
jgi:ParB-like chromosome segregation protein Spo0J